LETVWRREMILDEAGVEYSKFDWFWEDNAEGLFEGDGVVAKLQERVEECCISKKVKKMVLYSGAPWTTVDHCGPP
jgi:hypothetical protein